MRPRAAIVTATIMAAMAPIVAMPFVAAWAGEPLDPVEMRDYTPSAGPIIIPDTAGSSARTGGGDGTKPPTRARPSGTPPSLLPIPTAPPALVSPPKAGNTTGATNDFKADLLRPKVDTMRRDQSMGKTTADQQRQLMNKRQELRQLDSGSDRLR